MFRRILTGAMAHNGRQVRGKRVMALLLSVSMVALTACGGGSSSLRNLNSERMPMMLSPLSANVIPQWPRQRLLPELVEQTRPIEDDEPEQHGDCSRKHSDGDELDFGRRIAYGSEPSFLQHVQGLSA